MEFSQCNNVCIRTINVSHIKIVNFILREQQFICLMNHNNDISEKHIR